MFRETYAEHRGKCGDNGNHIPQYRSQESLLSKSVGHEPGFEFHRRKREVNEITYCGYLLKRSNHPFRTDFPKEDGYKSPPLPPCVDDAQLSQFLADCNIIDHGISLNSNPEKGRDIGNCHRPETRTSHGPQHLSTSDISTPILRSVDVLSSFFGCANETLPEMSLPPPNVRLTQNGSALISPDGILPDPRSTYAPATKSVPISVRGDRPLLPHPPPSPPTIHRNNSSSIYTADAKDTKSQPPVDFIDPHDGHIWRAKYCVLEDGVLYFYRNARDGSSTEAQAERTSVLGSTQPKEEDAMDLSKSPMTRKSYMPLATHSKEKNSVSCLDHVIWEKRVVLDRVGAVRSAQNDYGSCSFELLAVDSEDASNHNADEDIDSNDDEQDRLILRAGNLQEMNDWLFQFHRSLQSIMMQIVETVGSSAGPVYTSANVGGLPVPAGGIYNPSFALNNGSLAALVPPLPLSESISTPGRTKPAALSHGHGRSDLHRRRPSQGTLIDCVVDSPSSRPRSVGTPSDHHFSLLSLEGTKGMTRTESDSKRMDGNHSILKPTEVYAHPALPGSRSDHNGTVKSSSQLVIIPGPEILPQNKGFAPAKQTGGKYVPPHLRNKNCAKTIASGPYVPPQIRREKGLLGSAIQASASVGSANSHNGAYETSTYRKSEEYGAHNLSIENRGSSDHAETNATGDCHSHLKLGGCADPAVASGSILDSVYKPRKASRVGKEHTDGFGCFGGGVDLERFNKLVMGEETMESLDNERSVQWEVGAVSECGIRDSNEDSYLIASDLMESFRSLTALKGLPDDNPATSLWTNIAHHRPGLFAIFDGHCGNQAARYASEKLLEFLLEDSLGIASSDRTLTVTEQIEGTLLRALASLDDTFCRLCTEDGREWDSGTTAIVVTVVNDVLVIANLGDCRGVLCSSVEVSAKDVISENSGHTMLQREGWTELELDDDTLECDSNSSILCFWKEVAEIHSPCRDDERKRIEEANGWTTTETEMPIGQLKRMDFYDEDVVEILKRCFSDRYPSSQLTPSKQFSSAPHRILHISRVCGELAVSRALGDRDFKAEYNNTECSNEGKDSGQHANSSWENNDLFLPWPDNHNHRFVGDLVSSVPEVQTFKVGQKGLLDEFLLLACDGLWDVMDSDDAVRVTRGLLFEKKWSAKKAAARLAEIAIHLGSSDNITVIVIRFSS